MKLLFRVLSLILIAPLVIGTAMFASGLLATIWVVGWIYGADFESTKEKPGTRPG